MNTPSPLDITALGFQLRQLVGTTEREALPALIGAFEEAKALAWSRLTAPALPTPNTEPLLTAEELAALIKLPVHAVRDRARRGIIPSVPVGRFVRFQGSVVIAALKREAPSRSAHPVAAKNARKVSGLQGQCPPTVQS